MATFYGNSGNNHLKLRLDVNPRAQSMNVANNTSIIDWAIYIERGTSFAYNLDTDSPLTVTVDGAGQGITNHAYDLRNTSSVLLRSGSSTITHNGDGTKSLAVSATFNTQTVGVISVSGTVQLATIPRTSPATLSATAVDFGQDFTIYSNKKSGGFAHERYYVFDGKETRFGPNFIDSVVAQFPLDMMNMFGDRSSVPLVVRVKTFSGATFIGQVDVPITVRIPASVIPTFSGFSLTDTNAKARTLITGNNFVQGISDVQVTFNGATGAYSSVIRSYSAVVIGKSNRTDVQNGTLGRFNFNGQVVVRATVTDSRGRTSKPIDVTINVLEYFSPEIRFDVFRSGADLQTLTVSRTVKVAPLIVNGSQKNTMTVLFRTKLFNTANFVNNSGGGGTWTSLSSLTNSNANLVGVFRSDQSYQLEGVVTDYFTASVNSNLVSTEELGITITKNAVGVGKVWQRGTLDVGGDTFVDGKVNSRKVESENNGKKASMEVNANGVYNDFNTDVSGGYRFDKPLYVRGNIYAGANYNQTVWGDYNILTGTNSNGTYIKYPDGTQIVYGIHKTTLRALNTEIQNYRLGFPIAFVNADYVITFSQAEGHGLVTIASASIGQGSNKFTTSTDVSVKTFGQIDNDATIGIAYQAIGRWK